MVDRVHYLQILLCGLASSIEYHYLQIKPSDEPDCEITEFLPGWLADKALSSEASTVNGLTNHINSVATNMTQRCGLRSDLLPEIIVFVDPAHKIGMLPTNHRAVFGKSYSVIGWQHTLIYQE